MTPTTDTALWEYVHRLFGIGDWDELASDEPFWQYRQREVGKVKARRARLKVEIADLAHAADYCKAHGIDIRNVAWLYQYLPMARRWILERERAFSSTHLDELIARAVDHEHRNGKDGQWIDRLLRARGEHREEVLREWQQARNEALSPL